MAPKAAPPYVRVSTADRGQTIENQLLTAAQELGWTVVASLYRDKGISGIRGGQRPDWMLC